ncbi:MerR family transcriptional regulator [Mycolicibacterium frederiksbergense]|uniref:MerR family transcriptional regulator n=1 Tax=Mycolicibacterium frederiksbergense TaxID=117567 RepID=UPI001F38A125|nr:MerR family transcriptional regulator [Mycolicibacterium frederiksbergense]
MALNEYRIDDLARISGVTARNIRAYRERGLLDPPRRQGRSALYDDYHLAQLQTIDELLGRGFTSAHVAEFFETVRAGGSLAELLGLQRVIQRPSPESGEDPTPAGIPVGIDPASAEGARLVELELAHPSGSALVFANPDIGRWVAHSVDPLAYARIVITLLDTGRDGVEWLADAVISVLEREVAERFGSMDPNQGDIDRMGRWIADCVGIGHAVIADQLRRALLTRPLTAVPGGDRA